jgi:hypothetical protein
MAKYVCTAMAVMNKLDATSPIWTSHAWAQQIDVRTSIPSLPTHTAFSRNDAAWWISASRRL